MRTTNLVRRRDKHQPVLLIAALLVIGVIAGLFARHDVVGQNVYAFGIPLGGLTKTEAMQVVQDRVTQIEAGSLTFVAKDREVVVMQSELHVDLDEDNLAQELSRAVSSRSKLIPAFLSRLGAKTVMAAPARASSASADRTIAKIAKELSIEAMGMRYGFEGRDLKILPPSTGQVVTEDDVRRALQNVSGDRIEVDYVGLPAPAVSSLPELRLNGEYSTPYDLRQTDRNVNLQLAAEAVHGEVLVAGETYSFNKDAGERTEEKGYRYANVVVGDHLEPGLAGGICQVTTTLFDAAAIAGLDFPEVHAHGIPVDYVEPGADAAVAWNYLDLKIRNSTDGPIVFGAWVENGEVAVRVFGMPTDKTYEILPKVIATYPESQKEPGLLVETWRIEKASGREVGRKMLLRSRYLSHVKVTE